MRRLNVRQAQLQECIEESMFALGSRPSLQNGEILLLQLVKGDAKQAGKLHGRIEYALVFSHIEADPDGKISRKHWPKENRVWKWIIHGSETLRFAPFSLEDMDLSKDYSGQSNAQKLSAADEQLVLAHIHHSARRTR